MTYRNRNPLVRPDDAVPRQFSLGDVFLQDEDDSSEPPFAPDLQPLSGRRRPRHLSRYDDGVLD